MTYQPSLHDKVIVLADDPVNNLLGTIVGQATVILSESSTAVMYGDSRPGEIANKLIIELDSDSQGWMYNEDEQRQCHITTIVVDPSNVEPAPWFVNVYELDRVYGGPEEGGWWYDTCQRVHWQEFSTEKEARSYAESLADEYPSEVTPPITSIGYRGGAYSIQISNTKGELFYPPVVPTYE